MQMAASIGFLGNPWEFPMMSYVHTHACASVHVHACACMCMCVGGTLSCQITKNLINLDLIEIIQFCLKIYDL